MNSSKSHLPEYGKMSKAIFILSLALLTFSLTNSVKLDDKKAEDVANKRNDQGSMDDMDLMTAMNQCNETFRVEMSFLLALNESGSFPDETDRTPKCYVRCVLETSMVASEDGQYDPARAGIVFAGERGGKTMDDVENMATECATNRVETCKCERAYQFVKCLMQMEIKKYEKAE